GEGRRGAAEVHAEDARHAGTEAVGEPLRLGEVLPGLLRSAVLDRGHAEELAPGEPRRRPLAVHAELEELTSDLGRAPELAADLVEDAEAPEGGQEPPVVPYFPGKQLGAGAGLAHLGGGVAARHHEEGAKAKWEVELGLRSLPASGGPIEERQGAPELLFRLLVAESLDRRLRRPDGVQTGAVRESGGRRLVEVVGELGAGGRRRTRD